MKTLSKFFLWSILAFHLAVASADTSPAQQQPQQQQAPVSVGGFFSDLSGLSKQMSKATDGDMSSALYKAGLKIADLGKTKTFSKWLAVSLALVYLVIEAIYFMTGKRGSLASIALEVGIPVAFCAMLEANYSQVLALLSSGVLEKVRTIAADPQIKILDFYQTIFNMIGHAFATAGKDMFTLTNPITIVKNVGDFIATAIFAIIVIFFTLLGLAELIGLMLLGPFLGAIAIAFGPVFIATIVTPWTREYFGKWLGFLIGSAVLSGVLGVILELAMTLFSSFPFPKYGEEFAPNAVALLIALLIVITVNSLIAQAPAIASALVPGSIGASKGAGEGAVKAAEKIAKRASGAKASFREYIDRARGKK